MDFCYVICNTCGWEAAHIYQSYYRAFSVDLHSSLLRLCTKSLHIFDILCNISMSQEAACIILKREMAL